MYIRKRFCNYLNLPVHVNALKTAKNEEAVDTRQSTESLVDVFIIPSTALLLISKHLQNLFNSIYPIKLNIKRTITKTHTLRLHSK